MITKVTKKEFSDLLARIQMIQKGRMSNDSIESSVSRLTSESNRLKALEIAKSGNLVSLTRSLEDGIIQDQRRVSFPDPLYPAEKDTGVGIRDTWLVDYHGYSITHVDALCHIGYNGLIFGGIPVEEVGNNGRSGFDIIDTVGPSIITRGVIVPVSGCEVLSETSGTDRMERRYVTVTEFKQSLHENRIELRQGDCVLISVQSEFDDDTSSDTVILCPKVIETLVERDVMCIGADFDVDGGGFGVEGVRLPVHVAAIWAGGVPLIDNLNLSQLFSQINEKRVRQFCFVCAPIPVRGATGSPAGCFALM